MKITYESIVQKLGFDPMDPPEREFHGHEDDSIPSPYRDLTEEERDIIIEHAIKVWKLRE